MFITWKAATFSAPVRVVVEVTVLVASPTLIVSVFVPSILPMVKFWTVELRSTLTIFGAAAA